MRAIKYTGHNLGAVLDPLNRVTIINLYFPEVDFFMESERVDRHYEIGWGNFKYCSIFARILLIIDNN